MKFYYLELTEGEKVIKRKATSPATENKDRSFMERYHKKENQQIGFVVSSQREKVIN